MKNIKSAFTVDFEDWYQGFEVIPFESWKDYTPRIERNCRKILEILGNRKIRATFFVLGYIAENFPHLIEAIFKEGHEIGSHGYSHTQIFRLTPEKFDEEIRKTSNAVEKITGKKPIGFRAPIFSIIKESLWAIDVLAENGFIYDSSIYPTINYRYGIVESDRFFHYINTEKGNKIAEIPVTTSKFLKMNLPVGGGAYFRIWPFAVTRWGFRQVTNEGKPGVFYIHPWEIDTDQPRLKLPLRLSLTHYTNLRSTERRLSRMFDEFEFSSMSDVFGFEY